MWAVADNVSLFASMTPEEIVANLGGADRVAALTKLLEGLSVAGVQLFIVSIGYRQAFIPHLQTAGLLRFFPDEQVFGQDSPPLRSLGFVKGRLIAQIMAERGWGRDDVLFVDDTKDHIDRAADVCRTLLVSQASKRTVGGMAAAEFEAIREACEASVN